MSTQRLDFSLYPRLESQMPIPTRPAGFSVADRTAATANNRVNCSLKRVACASAAATTYPQSWITSDNWEKRKRLKRFSEQSSSEESVDIEKTATTREIAIGDFSLDNLYSLDFHYSQSMLPHLVTEIPMSMTAPPPSTTDTTAFLANSSLPFPTNANWIESVVSDVSERGDDRVLLLPDNNPKNFDSNSSSSGSIQKEREDSANRETEYPSQSGGTETWDLTVVADQGLELLELLVSCGEAIQFTNFQFINQCLINLGEFADPVGVSSMHRIAAYFTEALSLRMARLWPQIFKISPRDIEPANGEISNGFRILNNVSPIPKFLHFTANEMILRAFEGKDRVHIIDFDLKQGLQWPPLFQSLAMRPNPPSHVRITGIGLSKQELLDTGDRLSGFAESLNLPFEFHHVEDRLEDIRLWMLHVKDKECVAVNCMMQLHKLLYDGCALVDFLGMIKSIKPKVMVLAEQESENNNGDWLERFCNSLKYYSAIFDSIHACLPEINNTVRTKIEGLFAREISNIIASEGEKRTERHEFFSTWKTTMEECGFRCLGVGAKEMAQNKSLLQMYSGKKSYSATKQDGGGGGEGVTLSWLEQPLFTVSQWEIAETQVITKEGGGGGASSSFKQPPM